MCLLPAKERNKINAHNKINVSFVAKVTSEAEHTDCDFFSLVFEVQIEL